ncbi:hypothetical protein INS49_015256 [Diaporthe citri]|uniref:uncharacterized protein n=1 Tax=Diaporthe citri TaxID=83186 RepID=UPI001C7F75E8|nr:uncharacterized protein INS49_015256 [Diaporthe citri]KAG6355872.1 hypothetical protein INS49_015256 [Diaporthe citri]
MAEDAPSSSNAPSPGENPPTVNISIISPSLAVNAPLNFAGLPASTTVGQLKEKIREALDAKPANEQQRLIHQGKLLNRESETLLDVFGEQKLRGSDQVAIHLVIRDYVEPQHASSQGAPTRDQSPAPNPPARQSAPSLMQQYLNQLNQRPVGHHGQQPRGSVGLQGYVRETVGPNGEVVRVTMNSAFIAPNGQVFPVNFQNLQHGNGGAAAPAPGGPFSTNDVQNIIRNADASQATSMMTNAMHRSASGASLANLNLNGQRQPIQTPGVTVPRRPGSTVPLSRTATPDPTRTTSHGSVSAPPTNSALRMPTPTQPEVYILSSPQGPRALLVNNQSDLYYTPAPRYPVPPVIPNFTSAWLQPPQPHQRPGFVADHAQQAAHPQPGAARAEQQAPQAGNVRVNIFQGGAQQQDQQQQAQARPLAPGGPQFHPANPEGGLAGALLAALWPHLWLLIRLGVFVWWFTSSDTSWTRWFTIMSIATAVFLINTGLLNGVANNVFNPVRQHLDGLIPLAPGANANREAGGNNPQAADQAAPGGGGDNDGERRPRPGQQGGPDPAQAAARLIAQRQQHNANWFVDQVRRLERAGLLFLASIAPGVAERHIAALEAQERAVGERREAEERAERERREAEERAAAEATASGTDGAAASSETQNSDSAETVGGGNEQQQQQQPPIAAA